MIFLRCRFALIISSSLCVSFTSLPTPQFLYRLTPLTDEKNFVVVDWEKDWLNFGQDEREMHVLDSFVDPLTCRVTPAPSLHSVQSSYGQAYADVIFNNVELFLLSD